MKDGCHFADFCVGKDGLLLKNEIFPRTKISLLTGNF